MATEKRLIELDKALLVTVGESFPRPLLEHDEVLLATVRKKLRNLPYVDSVEVVHGRWIVENEESIRCSECCFNRATIKMPMDYCPNCGADMRERKDND